ncbi:MAG: hypothetical protein HOG03_21240 [Desulfobacula sp.]|uniref:hypothetical protein n=1 Tax=Desulfobacula sp. TaxID=2593537 RepID=UPI001ED2413C|nr:hypothetical protein [Desulfobacula sp.]
MTNFIKYFVILLSVLICLNTANAAKNEISILHTNDLHSHFLGFSPNKDYTPQTLSDDETIGGYARIATMIKKIKDQSKGPVLVLDGGDFLMGSFFICCPGKKPLNWISWAKWDMTQLPWEIMNLT